MADIVERPSVAPRIKKPFFRYDPIVTILLSFGIFFVSQFIAFIVVSVYPALKSWTEQQSIDWLTNSVAAQFAVMLVVAVVAMGLVFMIIKHARVRPARIGFVRPRMSVVGYAAGAYVLYFITYYVVLVVSALLIPSLNVDQPQQIGFDQVHSNGEVLMAFVSLVILPPLWEETVFRGFLFSSLRAKYRLRYAVIVTSILFGLVHLQFGSGAPLLWVAALDTFILSCFLCMLREKTGSIWASMLLHALKNSIAFYYLFIR